MINYINYVMFSILFIINPCLRFGLVAQFSDSGNFMLNKKTKQRIINKFKTHESDTGSTQVQIAILSEEIKELSNHLKQHKHDHSSRRGLLKKVSERRRLLKYLQKENEKSFIDLAKKLKLKIAKKMIADENEKQRIEQEMLAKEMAKMEEIKKKNKEEAEKANKK